MNPNPRIPPHPSPYPEIQPPLQRLLSACETICVTECCGLDAFDFSPIHMASYLIRSTGQVAEQDVQELRAAVGHLRQSCGASAGHTKDFSSSTLNAILTPQQVDELCAKLDLSLDTAIALVRFAEAEKSEGYPNLFGVIKESDPEVTPPLQRVLAYCEAVCAAGCCGTDAFDFSPVHIASCLLRPSVGTLEEKAQELRSGTAHLRQSCGASAGKTQYFKSRALHAIFSPQDVDHLCTEIEQNLDAAIALARQFSPPKPS